MSPPNHIWAASFRGEWFPAVLCALFAMVIALLGLLAALIQLWANMNLHFGSSFHIVIFAVGWFTVATCAYSAYRLIRYASYKSLWYVPLAGGMLALDCWLYSLPSAGHLMH